MQFTYVCAILLFSCSFSVYGSSIGLICVSENSREWYPLLKDRKPIIIPSISKIFYIDDSSYYIGFLIKQKTYKKFQNQCANNHWLQPHTGALEGWSIFHVIEENNSIAMPGIYSVSSYNDCFFTPLACDMND